MLQHESASDEDRTKRREEIIKARAKEFTTLFDRTMVGGRSPAEHEPTHKFTVMMSLSRAFYVVTKLLKTGCDASI